MRLSNKDARTTGFLSPLRMALVMAIPLVLARSDRILPSHRIPPYFSPH
ncbi:hypothetical protein [Leptospirillum ferrooxidans]|nr:hypothetical protein [Leptospirillum ferrooxidans]